MRPVLEVLAALCVAYGVVMLVWVLLRPSRRGDEDPGPGGEEPCPRTGKHYRDG